MESNKSNKTKKAKVVFHNVDWELANAIRLLASTQDPPLSGKLLLEKMYWAFNNELANSKDSFVLDAMTNRTLSMLKASNDNCDDE